MKKILQINFLFVALLLLFKQVCYSQDKTGALQISGIIKDFNFNKRIEGAEVSIIIRGVQHSQIATSNNQGYFTLQVSKGGADTASLSVSAKGYKALNLRIIVNPTLTKIFVDTIKLIALTTELKEVTIRTSALSQTIDKTVLIVTKDIVTTSPTISEVMAHLPFVSVTSDNDITLKGKTGIKYYLDNRSVTIERIRAIPPSKVARVELNTNPGPEYDAEGITAIINVVLKEDKLDGYEGSIDGSAATGNKYSGTFYSSIKKKGSTTTLNYVINSTHKIGNRNGVSSNNDSLSIQNGTRTNNQIYQYAGIAENYVVDPNNIFGASLGWYQYRFHRTSDIQFGGEIMSIYPDLSSRNNTVINGFLIDADYKHIFDKSSSLTISYRKVITNTRDSLYQDNGVFNTNKINFTENSYQVWLTNILKPKVTLQTGFKAINRINNTANFYQSPVSGTLSPLNYHQDVYAAFASLNIPVTKSLTAKFGGRFEITHINADFEPNIIRDNNYNFFPNLTLMQSLKNGQSLKFTYSERISRPSIEYLNPYLNQSDPQNLSTGNPNLKSEINHSAEIKYSATIKQTYIETAFNFNSTPGQIISVVSPLGNGQTLSTFQNVGEHLNFEISSYVSTKIMKNWDLSNSLAVSRATYSGNGDNNSGFNYFASLDNTIKLFNGYLLSVGGSYVSRQIRLQGYSGRAVSDNVRVSKRFLKSKLIGRIGVEDPLSVAGKFTEYSTQGSFYSKYNYGFNNRRLAFSISYSFGKQNSTDPYANKINNSDLKQTP